MLAADRFYVWVYSRRNGTVTDFKLYFDQHWKLGRVLDRVAQIVGIQNDNNLATAPKLHLFHGNTGQKLLNDLPLHQAVENGMSVIIEKGIEEANPSDVFPQ